MEQQQLLHCLINNSHLLAPHVLKLLPAMICLQGKKDLHVNSPFSSLHTVLGKQTNKSQGNPSVCWLQREVEQSCMPSMRLNMTVVCCWVVFMIILVLFCICFT
jgi:hypothetical protein